MPFILAQLSRSLLQTAEMEETLNFLIEKREQDPSSRTLPVTSERTAIPRSASRPAQLEAEDLFL